MSQPSSNKAFRVRSRWIAAPLVFMLALVASSAVFVALGSSLWWAASSAAVVTMLEELIARPWWERRRAESEHDRDAVSRLRRHLGRQSGLPKAAGSDPLRLGVHPALSLARDDSRTGLDPLLPEWVERTVCTGPSGLVAWIERAQASGGFLLLLGDSSVGKTRLLYHLMQEKLGHFHLLQPDSADIVNRIAEAHFRLPPMVVWLDELQMFLEGPFLRGDEPLLLGNIRRLLNSPTPVVILGTIWSSTADTLLAKNEDGSAPAYPRADEVLGLPGLHTVVLTSFNDQERERAELLGDKDPRHKVSLADKDYGPTEVLAGGPALIRRWLTAPPEVRAIINGAVDAHRMGLTRPLTPSVLCDLARVYLPTPISVDDSLREALGRASHVRIDEANTALLIPATDIDNREVLGYRIADYLLQYAVRDRQSIVPPDLAWRIYLDVAEESRTLHSLGRNAALRALLGHAEALYSKAFTKDPSVVDLSLSYLYRESERPGEAIEMYRQLIQRGENVYYTKLGDLLYRHNGYSEARAMWEEALSVGHDDAPLSLIFLEANEGNWKAAEQLCERAIATGSHGAYGAYADILEQQDRFAEAEKYHLKAVEVGEAGSRQPMIDFYERWGKTDRAEQLLREAVEAGESKVIMTEFLERQGRDAELEEFWTEALKIDGSVESQIGWHFFGNYLLSVDRVEEAEQLFIRGAAINAPFTHQMLAHLLETQERFDEAEVVLRQFLDTDKPRNFVPLAWLLARQGRYSEAEQLCRKHVALGADDALDTLAGVLESAGRTDEAGRLRRNGLTPDGELAAPPHTGPTT